MEFSQDEIDETIKLWSEEDADHEALVEEFEPNIESIERDFTGKIR